jgi:glycosyltransferase involved in cell wall biosynthesis
VAAARLLRDDGERFQIVLAGDGPARTEIERAIAHAHLENCISITGWLSGEQVKQEIERARALVLPSFSENKPVVIMEALALKRPVISTFIAGIPELVEPGKTGWLVPAGDERALASALQSALHTSAERLTTMGEAGRAHILHQHDALKEARKLKSLIEKAGALKRSESRAVLGPATPQQSG